MRKIFLLLTLLNCGLLASAFQMDSVLLATLAESKMTLSFDGSGLKGAGADFLIKEADKAHYFLIGEDHGIAQLPEFTSAMLRALAPRGYQHYATEIGPVSADLITHNLKSKSPVMVFSKLFEVYPFAIPFFTWKNEAEVVQVLKEETGLLNHNLWGLDQEFIISARMLLNHLREIALDDNARSLAELYYQKAMKGFEEAVATKVPAIFLTTAQPDDYARLKEAFKHSEQALRLLSELEESQEIYAKIMMRGEGFQSNQQRANMMKRHFMEAYERASRQEEAPKVIVKLGANHVYKGYNSLGALDLGNFVNEFAVTKGQQSFHIYVGAHKGNQNAFNLLSQSEADKKKAFDNSESQNAAAFYKAANGETSLFDLRPLRALIFNKRLKDLAPELEKLIYSYDAFLVIPEATASQNYR